MAGDVLHPPQGLGLSAQRVDVSPIAENPGGDPGRGAGRRTGQDRRRLHRPRVRFRCGKADRPCLKSQPLSRARRQLGAGSRHFPGTVRPRRGRESFSGCAKIKNFAQLVTVAAAPSASLVAHQAYRSSAYSVIAPIEICIGSRAERIERFARSAIRTSR